MQVPFFRYPHVYDEHRVDIEQALLRTAASGSYIMQQELREFEERLAEYCGVHHGVGVGNATDGLELNTPSAACRPAPTKFPALTATVTSPDCGPPPRKRAPTTAVPPSSNSRRYLPLSSLIALPFIGNLNAHPNESRDSPSWPRGSPATRPGPQGWQWSLPQRSEAFSTTPGTPFPTAVPCARRA